MPVYLYQCPVCGLRFEKNLRYSEADQRISCPNGHPNVRKVFSMPAVIYKGSGFYVTDHAAKRDSPV